MGFAVVGPDHMIGSGHPDVRTDLPPLLGLIQSRDPGQNVGAHLAPREGGFPRATGRLGSNHRLRRVQPATHDQPASRSQLGGTARS
jgi:hypothetical protein